MQGGSEPLGETRNAGAGPRPWVVLVGLLLLSLAYNWYYLTGGFHADDLLLINLLREDPLRFSRWCGLWSTFDIPGFMSMWWADPDIAVAFCRPLTSLVFEGSIRVFGETALPLHLLSVVLHGLVAGGLPKGATLFCEKGGTWLGGAPGWVGGRRKGWHLVGGQLWGLGSSGSFL